MTGTSFIPVFAAILVVVLNRKIINRFKNSSATTASGAKTLDELNLRRNRLFNNHVNRGHILEVGGRFYLDEQKLLAYQTRLRLTLLPAVLCLIAILIAADLWLNR